MSDCTPERRWKLFCLRSQTLHLTLLQLESRAVLLPSDRSELVLGSLFCNWRFCESQTSADSHSSHWLKSPPEGMCLSSLIGRSEACCTKTVTNIRGNICEGPSPPSRKTQAQIYQNQTCFKASNEQVHRFGSSGAVELCCPRVVSAVWVCRIRAHIYSVCLCACVLLFSFFSHFLRFNYFDGVVIFIYVFIFWAILLHELFSY